MNRVYFSASSCAAFLNGLHVDQMYALNYKDSVPKIPIYGYNDYEFSRVIRGKQVIQGVFVVNFIHPSYLTDILESRNSAYVPRLYNYAIAENSQSNDTQFRASLDRQLRNELPPNTDSASKKARAEYIASIISPKNPRSVKATKEALNRFFTSNPIDDEPTSSLKTGKSALLVQTEAQIGNQLDVYYQDPSYISWFVRFNDVHFSEESQQISQAGAEGSADPLYLIYQFFAKSKEIKRVT